MNFPHCFCFFVIIEMLYSRNERLDVSDKNSLNNLLIFRLVKRYLFYRFASLM